MITGRSCLQGGIDMSGIAHAGTFNLQTAMWFSGDDYVLTTHPSPQTFVLSFDLFVPSSRQGSAQNGILLFGSNALSLGVYMYLRFDLFGCRVMGDVKSFSFLPYYGETVTIRLEKLESSANLYCNDVLQQSYGVSTMTYYNSNVRIGNTAAGWYLTGMLRDLLLAPYAEWKGHGITNTDWSDPNSPATVYGSPERCLIRADGAVILNNQIVT